MNILWWHFHCWHIDYKVTLGGRFGRVRRRTIREHGLVRGYEDIDQHRCCQCPAIRQGYSCSDGSFVTSKLIKEDP